MSSTKSSKSYHDAETLQTLYWDDEMSQTEIAEMFGCNQGTISYYMRKFGIERRDDNYAVREATKVGDGSYRDEETLRELYWDREMSLSDIADEFGCHQTTVVYWMVKNGIPRRDNLEASRDAARREWVSHGFNVRGYERWQDEIAGEEVRVHWLLAIADGADPHEVFADGTDCHHSTHHPRDNRPGVVEVMTRSEHASYHNRQETPEWKQELIKQIERTNSAAEVDW